MTNEKTCTNCDRYGPCGIRTVAVNTILGLRLQLKFLLLKAEWETDTFLLSSITQICMHPAYQKIIGMGQSAIPLILAEMQKVPGHWFWALRAISGVDNTSPEDRGNISRMTEAWLNWGREGGYLSE